MKKHKIYLSILSILLAIIVIPGSSWAKHLTTKAGDFAGGIINSRHNLSTSGKIIHSGNNLGPLRADDTRGTSEVCVFCHTPHFTDRGEGPLWNRSRAGGEVSAYGNTIAENNDGNSNMFSSLACLSCHDGVTTFDSIINRPGKGRGGIPNGPSGWYYSMPGGASAGNFGHALDSFSSSSCGTCHSGSPPDVLRDIGRLVIGEQTAGGATDLRNDHPIGVVYRGKGDAGASASLRATSTIISGINLNIATENATDQDALVKGNLWAVKGFISNTATISNLLRSGNGSASDDSRQYVQCASCHDLHYKNLTNPEREFVNTYIRWGTGGFAVPIEAPVGKDGVANNADDHQSDEIDGLFLRRVGGNTDSGVCRTCHAK